MFLFFKVHDVQTLQQTTTKIIKLSEIMPTTTKALQMNAKMFKNIDGYKLTY